MKGSATQEGLPRLCSSALKTLQGPGSRPDDRVNPGSTQDEVLDIRPATEVVVARPAICRVRAAVAVDHIGAVPPEQRVGAITLVRLGFPGGVHSQAVVSHLQ